MEGLSGKPGFEEIGEGDARVWRYRVAPDLVAPDLGPSVGDRGRLRRIFTTQPAWLTAPAAGETARAVTLNPVDRL